MTVATTTQYWNSRMNGNNPVSLSGSFQDSWTASVGGGVKSGGDWVITNGTYTITPTTNTAYTFVTCLSYNTAPNDDEVLIKLDNGTHKIEVKGTGNATSLKLVGATTVTITDLDLLLTESKPVPLILRVTLDELGNAQLYTHEIMQNDDAVNVFYSVSGANGATKTIQWGNTNGSIKWSNVYYSKFGAFNPEELMTSDFSQNVLSRMGIGIVDLLKNTTRIYLKTQVPISNILYGYDISSDMLNRYTSPNIHVLIEGLDSPSFDTLGGSKVLENYDVTVYVTTRGTNYENAYKQGLNILGEVFDEIYTNTGVNATTDSLVSYTAELDTKKDDDETVCVHTLTLTYMRKIDMRHR
tara:strand:- start:4115 stop:5179 length:1065 start_codon:yes stop_codon:yes gene_type:complete